jgi:hypothetical protein
MPYPHDMNVVYVLPVQEQSPAVYRQIFAAFDSALAHGPVTRNSFHHALSAIRNRRHTALDDTSRPVPPPTLEHN